MNRREFALALAASLTPLPAFGAFAADRGRASVVMVLKTLSSEFWKTVAAGARAAASEYGVDLAVLAPSTEDEVEQQLAIVQAVEALRPAALIFAPAEPEIAVNALTTARKKAIPVLLIDTGMPTAFTDYTTFIGSDNVAAGRVGGAALAKLLEPGQKVLLLDGRPGNSTMNDRCDGAEATLTAAGVIVASRKAAFSDRERAYLATEDFLRGTSGVAGVFAANDEQALGALKACVRAGKSMPIIGVDATTKGLNAVLDGGLYATVAQDSYGMGRLGVEKALAVLAGEPVDKRIVTPATLITKDNALPLLDQRNQILAPRT